MINPSANGWIDKFFVEQISSRQINDNETDFYTNIRETGFIYGHIVAFNSKLKISSENWLRDEISKIALLSALFDIYCIYRPNETKQKFVNCALNFYTEMQPGGFNLLNRILPKNSAISALEKVLDDRVQTNENIISKNFSHIVTNALLFVDILAFQKFLKQGAIPEKYLKRFEESIIGVVSLALQSKVSKSKHEKLLLNLFESSLRYTKFSKITVENFNNLQLENYCEELEKLYLVDIACLAMWSDKIIDANEEKFLYRLGKALEVSSNTVLKSIEQVNTFITQYKDEIPFFNDSNPVKYFYEQTTQLVITLINRNKKRLAKEIGQNRELMILLTNTAIRDLDKSEKKKVKKQLLEICKTIPSLTIFLIPGGSLLLPILIKFIPQLLPKSFNENLDN